MRLPCKSGLRFERIVMRLAACLLLILSPAVLLLGAAPGGPVWPAEFRLEEQAVLERNLAIVVNLTNPIEGLSMQELRRVFLGERGHWPNGRRITLVMLEPGRPERAAVLNSIYHMNETDFSNHFLRGLFTGEVFVSPKTLATPEGVRKFIFNVPGAIGYLRGTDVDKTVKVIRIDERLPDEKGYKLHVPPR
jgi:ABC-type phosphate transport system substrate-binding protein